MVFCSVMDNTVHKSNFKKLLSGQILNHSEELGCVNRPYHNQNSRYFLSADLENGRICVQSGRDHQRQENNQMNRSQNLSELARKAIQLRKLRDRSPKPA